MPKVLDCPLTSPQDDPLLPVLRQRPQDKYIFELLKGGDQSSDIQSFPDDGLVYRNYFYEPCQIEVFFSKKLKTNSPWLKAALNHLAEFDIHFGNEAQGQAYLQKLCFKELFIDKYPFTLKVLPPLMDTLSSQDIRLVLEFLLLGLSYYNHSFLYEVFRIVQEQGLSIWQQVQALSLHTHLYQIIADFDKKRDWNALVQDLAEVYQKNCPKIQTFLNRSHSTSDLYFVFLIPLIREIRDAVILKDLLVALNLSLKNASPELIIFKKSLEWLQQNMTHHDETQFFFLTISDIDDEETDFWDTLLVEGIRLKQFDLMDVWVRNKSNFMNFAAQYYHKTPNNIIEALPRRMRLERPSAWTKQPLSFLTPIEWATHQCYHNYDPLLRFFLYANDYTLTPREHNIDFFTVFNNKFLILDNHNQFETLSLFNRAQLLVILCQHAIEVNKPFLDRFSNKTLDRALRILCECPLRVDAPLNQPTTQLALYYFDRIIPSDSQRLALAKTLQKTTLNFRTEEQPVPPLWHFLNTLFINAQDLEQKEPLDKPNQHVIFINQTTKTDIPNLKSPILRQLLPKTLLIERQLDYHSELFLTEAEFQTYQDLQHYPALIWAFWKTESSLRGDDFPPEIQFNLSFDQFFALSKTSQVQQLYLLSQHLKKSPNLRILNLSFEIIDRFLRLSCECLLSLNTQPSFIFANLAHEFYQGRVDNPYFHPFCETLIQAVYQYNIALPPCWDFLIRLFELKDTLGLCFLPPKKNLLEVALADLNAAFNLTLFKGSDNEVLFFFLHLHAYAEQYKTLSQSDFLKQLPLLRSHAILYFQSDPVDILFSNFVINGLTYHPNRFLSFLTQIHSVLSHQELWIYATQRLSCLNHPMLRSFVHMIVPLLKNTTFIIYTRLLLQDVPTLLQHHIKTEKLSDFLTSCIQIIKRQKTAEDIYVQQTLRCLIFHQSPSLFRSFLSELSLQIPDLPILTLFKQVLKVNYLPETVNQFLMRLIQWASDKQDTFLAKLCFQLVEEQVLGLEFTLAFDKSLFLVHWLQNQVTLTSALHIEVQGALTAANYLRAYKRQNFFSEPLNLPYCQTLLDITSSEWRLMHHFLHYSLTKRDFFYHPNDTLFQFYHQMTHQKSLHPDEPILFIKQLVLATDKNPVLIPELSSFLLIDNEAHLIELFFFLADRYLENPETPLTPLLFVCYYQTLKQSPTSLITLNAGLQKAKQKLQAIKHHSFYAKIKHHFLHLENELKKILVKNLSKPEKVYEFRIEEHTHTANNLVLHLPTIHTHAVTEDHWNLIDPALKHCINHLTFDFLENLLSSWVIQQPLTSLYERLEDHLHVHAKNHPNHVILFFKKSWQHAIQNKLKNLISWFLQLLEKDKYPTALLLAYDFSGFFLQFCEENAITCRRPYFSSVLASLNGILVLKRHHHFYRQKLKSFDSLQEIPSVMWRLFHCLTAHPTHEKTFTVEESLEAYYQQYVQDDTRASFLTFLLIGFIHCKRFWLSLPNPSVFFVDLPQSIAQDCFLIIADLYIDKPFLELLQIIHTLTQQFKNQTAFDTLLTLQSSFSKAFRHPVIKQAKHLQALWDILFAAEIQSLLEIHAKQQAQLLVDLLAEETMEPPKHNRPPKAKKNPKKAARVLIKKQALPPRVIKPDPPKIKPSKPKALLPQFSMKKKVLPPFVYPSNYLQLQHRCAQWENLLAQSDHPLHPFSEIITQGSAIVNALQAGLQQALLPYAEQGVCLEQLRAQAIDLKSFSEPLTWAIEIEEILRNLSDSEAHQPLKNLAKILPQAMAFAQSHYLSESIVSTFGLVLSLVKNIYPSASDKGYKLYLYGSAAQYWLALSLKLKIRYPNDLDFTLVGPLENSSFPEVLKYLSDIPNLNCLNFRQDPNNHYVQFQLRYYDQNIDLSFHSIKPLALASGSIFVELPLDPKLSPRFELDPQATIHFKHHKWVITAEKLKPFLTDQSLHFALKELALRMNEDWKISETTIKSFVLEEHQVFLTSNEADISIGLFLSRYVTKNPEAYFKYFQKGPEPCHALYFWFKAFSVPELAWKDFQKKIPSILSNVSYPPESRYRKMINLCLKTLVYQGQYEVDTYQKRLFPILQYLQQRLGTSFFQPKNKTRLKM